MVEKDEFDNYFLIIYGHSLQTNIFIWRKNGTTQYY